MVTMPRLCQWVPGVQAGTAHQEWPPSGRLTHLRTKVSGAHPGIPGDQTHFSHKQHSQLPSRGLPSRGKPSRNGPDQDLLQSKKTLLEALSQVTLQDSGWAWKKPLVQ